MSPKTIITTRAYSYYILSILSTTKLSRPRRLQLVPTKTPQSTILLKTHLFHMKPILLAF